MKGQLEIKGQPSKSENVFFFTSSITFLDHLTAECHSKEEAQGSALFIQLFELPWVSEAAVEGRALIVKKKGAYPSWKECAPEVASLIRSLHQENAEFFSASFINDLKLKKKEEEERSVSNQLNKANVSTPEGQAIQKFLTEKITPALASHGGQVTLTDLKEGIVFLNFGGGCQGCSQITLTVKEGVEQQLLKEFPSLKTVVDVTDHSAGKNPFYK